MKIIKKVALAASVMAQVACAMEKIERPLTEPTRVQVLHPTFQGIPRDIQAIIMSHVMQSIVVNDLDETLKNINNFALVNKDFRNFLNQPQNIKWLVTTIAQRGFERSVDIDWVANHLKKMPGMQNPEIKKWLNGFKLVRAAQYGKLEELQQLLNQGTDVNAILTYAHGVEHTALTNAAIENSAIVQTLLKAGANVNALNGKALRLAAIWANPEVVRELLKYNPDLTLKNDSGRTALDIAILAGDAEIIDLIRQKEEEYKAKAGK